MIKKIIKIVLIIFLILTLIIFYLSIFGIKTDKFNNQITNSILKINKKINLSLSDVSYLLNPYDFTINIKTKNPKILLEGRSFGIKTIQTNIALKSLINDQFLIDDLQIITKEIKLSNIITLARVFKNSQQLFILGTFIKDGIVTASMNFNFDDKGEIKKNYKIKGTVKKVKLNILNQFKLQDLNFNFNISKNIYSLKKLDTKFNGIKLIVPQIEIKKNKNSFFVDGQLLTKKKNFDIKELKSIFVNFLNEVDIQKIEFSSKNNFSFNINKNLKFDSLKIESVVDLEQLIVKKKDFQLKQYLPSFVKEIKLEKHNIIINYNKKKFDIKGNGNFLLEDKSDEISYHIIKNKNDLSFDSKMNLKNNSLLINFLDYEKKEGLNSLVSIKGNFKKNNQLSFDLINIKEKNNGIVIKGLELSKSFKILDITNLNINYRNNNNKGRNV